MKIYIKIQIMIQNISSYLNQTIRSFFYNNIRKKIENLLSMFKSFKQLHQVLPKHVRVYNSLSHRMPHYAYPASALNSVQYQHIEPTSFKDKMAYKCIKFIRSSYDWLTKYDPENMTQKKWISRCMFLETVAGVPGMVGGMARHLRSLRTMKRDNGWIHHLIEQADNERFHLIIFLNLKKPTLLERAMIISLQGIFMNSFFISYLLNPKFCHRFVGYLEEQAVKTYTKMLEDIENPQGPLHHWNNMPAPKEAILYYQLDQKATYKQVIMSIRADQACHRQTNHFFADIDSDYDIKQEKTQVYNEENWTSKEQEEQKGQKKQP